MTNTRDKLNEAKHFLGKMSEATSELDKFRYELTAFLSASRSITQIMQKEFSGKSGFGDWYKQKQKEMEQNGTLKYLHRQRSITFHEHPVLPYPIQATSQVSDATGMRVFITGTGSALDLNSVFVPFPVISTRTVVRYYFNDIPTEDRDVVTICIEAIKALEIVVSECESKFCS